MCGPVRLRGVERDDVRGVADLDGEDRQLA